MSSKMMKMIVVGFDDENDDDSIAMILLKAH